MTTGAGSASADDSRDDDDGDEGREGALEMVLSPGLTPAGALMIPRRLEGMPEATKQGLRQLEISPRALAVWERIAERLEAHGGAALAIDYGEEGPLGDSLRAIKDHAFVPPLRDPGAADLSAYVDFGAMRRVIETREPSEGAVGGGVECYGPIAQRDLLFGLGIQERLERLVGECETEEQAEKVYVACERLVGGDDVAAEGGGGEVAARAPGMGFRYKALAMVSKGTGVPAGFQR
jgi:NADH dehydrogenase [ubiquinone] 1 alpha subcomplex assembly factor 7